jgi:hypothetical protein
MSELRLGKLVSEHGIAPALVQRAMIVAVLSFVFFMAMMIAFYLRQKLGYFLLSSGFLVLYVLTMFGWLMLRRNVVKVYENGLVYRKFAARWPEIAAVETERESGKITCRLVKTNGEKTILTDAVQGVEGIIAKIETERLK